MEQQPLTDTFFESFDLHPDVLSKYAAQRSAAEPPPPEAHPAAFQLTTEYLLRNGY